MPPQQGAFSILQSNYGKQELEISYKHKNTGWINCGLELLLLFVIYFSAPSMKVSPLLVLIDRTVVNCI